MATTLPASSPPQQPHSSWQPVHILCTGFAAVILVGALLLTLPIASTSGRSIGFLDALFTATSAVCVTGLAVAETGLAFSLFGQWTILLLIQVGGLGFMTMTTLVFLIMGKRITLKERLIIQESMNETGLGGLIRLIRWVLLMTAVVEGCGAALLATRFVPQFGWATGIYYSIFHSISAFCNAGFDVLGNGDSMAMFAGDYVVNFVLMGLITCGGIGYAVIRDVWKNRGLRGTTLHTRVVLSMSLGLVVIGTLFFAISEWNNPLTIGNPDLNWGQKLLASMFQSVTTRTAGFATIDQRSLNPASKMMGYVLMLIGASPASTGGGIKTTTTALLIAIIVAQARGRNSVSLFGRSLPMQLVLRAVAVFIIALLMVMCATVALVLTMDPNQVQLEDVVYECVSALGTVGLSCSLTPRLNQLSRFIVIIMMFAGRVGPLSLTMALARKQHSARNSIHFPEDKLMIG